MKDEFIRCQWCRDTGVSMKRDTAGEACTCVVGLQVAKMMGADKGLSIDKVKYDQK